MPSNGRPNAGGAAGDGEAMEGWRAEELQRLVADIAARLRKACAHLSDEEFSALVMDIAMRRLRFDAMDPMTGKPRERSI